ncbi:hypothetical protein CFK37_07280 [Virgibacillus phasianinus]|uniref:Transcriptional regulator n=1 Tax=Virgibacillus phasianinus TaxID=2017483 RepID=A0A220U171_9BACI|nr:hypothetical protein [Virgibacillus phasianinus]ASK61974.1 hypothetical protein CFK37_07280 [Virgibacillus phasianinus]
MKIKIALFGRNELIERMNDYVDNQDDIEIIPFAYSKAVENIDLIDKAFMCDVYLFGGSLSYLYAKEKIERKRLPAIQVAFDEYMILTSFYRLKNYHNQELDRISIDVLYKEHVDEVISELQMEDREIYTYSYGDDAVLDIGKIFHYHKKLFQEGKIDYVLTSIEEVEQRLIDEGIPTSCMVIPKLNLERAVEKAKSIATLNKSKSAQIVSGFVQIKNFEDIVSKKGEFVAQEMLLKLHQILLKFGHKTYASVLTNGDNQFSIFGTRGILDHITNHYRDFPLLQEIARSLGVPVEIGFGLGLTAKQAEDNAKLALETCVHSEESSCFIVNERKETIGPLGVAKHVDTSELYHALIHRARLNNELSYNFIDFINLRNNEPFSANDISNYYQVTKRSAERTIHKLLAGEVIRVVGEEKPYVKGRPRKLFELTL